MTYKYIILYIEKILKKTLNYNYIIKTFLFFVNNNFYKIFKF